MGVVAHYPLLLAGVRPGSLRVHQPGHVLRLLHRLGDRGRLRKLHVPVLPLLCVILLLADRARGAHACSHRDGPCSPYAIQLRWGVGLEEEPREESHEQRLAGSPGGPAHARRLRCTCTSTGLPTLGERGKAVWASRAVFSQWSAW
eukprot:UN0958